jgi:hypothetical protein
MPLNLRIKAEDVQKGDRIKIDYAWSLWDNVRRIETGPRFVNLHVDSTTYLCIERDAEIEVVR